MELLLQRWLEDANHLAVDVVDRRGEEEQGTDQPTNIGRPGGDGGHARGTSKGKSAAQGPHPRLANGGHKGGVLNSPARQCAMRPTERRSNQPESPLEINARAHSTYVVRRLGGGKSRVAGARIRPRLRERSPTPFAYPPSLTETTLHIPWMCSRLRRSPRARRACETPGGPRMRWPQRRPRQQKPRGWHRWRTAGSSGARRPESPRRKPRPDP